jgi:hypothetical protein
MVSRIQRSRHKPILSDEVARASPTNPIIKQDSLSFSIFSAISMVKCISKSNIHASNAPSQLGRDLDLTPKCKLSNYFQLNQPYNSKGGYILIRSDARNIKCCIFPVYPCRHSTLQPSALVSDVGRTSEPLLNTCCGHSEYCSF